MSALADAATDADSEEVAWAFRPDRPGWEAAEVMTWEEASVWQDHGFTAQTAILWVRQGFRTADKAARWRDAGFTEDTAVNWSEVGFTDPTVAADWSETLGHDAAAFAFVKYQEGHTTEQALREWVALGFGDAAT